MSDNYAKYNVKEILLIDANAILERYCYALICFH
jgi:hypothetical protein